MGWKGTLGLVLLASAAGAWYWKGDEWGPKLGLGTPAAPAASPSLDALSGKLTPAAVSRVEVDGLVLEKRPDGWRLPGNWPLREAEVNELVQLVTGLSSRFQPVPIDAGADLTQYGLAPAQKPVTVKLRAGGTDTTLTIGEPPPAAGEPPFARPAYLRVNDLPEVVRLGPDVLPVLRRPADNYRRRQLVPDAERVKVASASAAGPFAPPGAVGVSPVILLGDGVKELTARAPGQSVTVLGLKVSRPETYTLRKTGPLPKPAAVEAGGEPALNPDRIAEAWEVAAPARDRVDPDKLQRILSAVPDLWVEEFVTTADKPTGLDKPERTLTVTPVVGDPLVIQFGEVAKTTTREEPVAPPNIPGAPPMPPTTRTVTEEYRYAKLADNPQVFTVKAAAFADLFVRAAELRDARVARFSPDEAEAVTVAAPGKPGVTLTRLKGDPKAEAFADRADRWVIGADKTPAEPAAVTDLLRPLSELRAGPGDAEATLPEPATKVTVTAREKRPDGEPAAPVRTYTLHVGPPRPDPAAVAGAAAGGPLAVLVGLQAVPSEVTVRLDGWPRVVKAEAGGPDGSVARLLDRPAAAYRRKRLFDPNARVAAVAFSGGAAAPANPPGATPPRAKVVGLSSFTLTPADGGAGWEIRGPFTAAADPAEAAKLVGPLADLRAAEWVGDAAADPARYGLDKPRRVLTLNVDGKPRALALGGPRDGKPEVYARLDDGPVFTLPTAAVDPLLAASPLALRDKALATFPAADKVVVTRDGRAITFAKADGTWAMTDPKPGPAEAADLDRLVKQLGRLRADALVTDKPTPDELVKFGLDKPAVLLTASAAGKEVLALQVGATDAGGRAYARVGVDGPVALLDVADAVAVTAEYRRRKVWDFDEARVESIAVVPLSPAGLGAVGATSPLAALVGAAATATGRGGFTLVRKDAGWLIGDRPADDLPASELLTTLGGLRAARWVGDPPADLKTPTATVTLTLRGGAKRVLAVGGRFARTDGGEAFELARADAEVLMRPQGAYRK